MPDDITLVEYERGQRRAVVERWPTGWRVYCYLDDTLKLRLERDDPTKARQGAREWVEDRRQSHDIAHRRRSLRERGKNRKATHAQA